MGLRDRYPKLLGSLLAAGAVGGALLLASAAQATAEPDPSRAQPGSPHTAPVAERLAAIRAVVSDVAGGRSLHRGEQFAWWAWRNGGGGWRNGGWGWRNGGPWGNGGWRNGGWRNYWRNF